MLYKPYAVEVKMSAPASRDPFFWQAKNWNARSRVEPANIVRALQGRSNRCLIAMSSYSWFSEKCLQTSRLTSCIYSNNIRHPQTLKTLALHCSFQDILDEVPWGLKPVGRLDKDTTGLMILTNDAKVSAVCYLLSGVCYLLSTVCCLTSRSHDVKVYVRIARVYINKYSHLNLLRLYARPQRLFA
jgi:hypothetical protein